MHRWTILASGSLIGSFLLGFLLTAAPSGAQQAVTPSGAPAFGIQTEPEKSPPGIAAQPGADKTSPGIAAQPDGDDDSLEIAPQDSDTQPKPGSDDFSSDREFTPAEEYAKLDRNFQPSSNESRKPPYLGITVRYTTLCYLGQEEDGLEVMSVNPNGPAGLAGVTGMQPSTKLGMIGATAGNLLGPVTFLVTPLLERAGALGRGGDLIVAVDDRRVRKTEDLENAMKQLKPGDTMWITVIRPLPGGAHKSFKIAIKIGQVNQPVANAEAAPPASSSSESNAY